MTWKNVFVAYFFAPLSTLLCVFSTSLMLAQNAHSETELSIQPPASTSLEGSWKFQAGDNVVWASPAFDDAHWSSLAVPGSWPEAGFPDTGQRGWYRLTVKFDPQTHGDLEQLGVRIGAIRSAYEIYLGGQLQGGVGKLPPHGKINFDKLRVYPIPLDAIDSDGNFLIALRVWGGSDLGVRKSGGGAYSGEFLLGNYTQLFRALDAEQLPKLLFAALFLGMGSYFIYLYLRNTQMDSFLWFGLNAILIGIYIVTQSQWKYVFDLPFVAYEKIETGSIYLISALFPQLIWTMVDRPIGRILRTYQAMFLLAALAIILVPGMAIHYTLRGYWTLAVIPGFIATIGVVVQQARAKNRDARTLLVAILIYSACALNDILILTQTIQSIRLMPLGFTAVLVSMGVMLANRFTTMLNFLEREVTDRTSALSSANQQLESLNLQLEQLARRDPLTDMLNRRGFVEEAEIEIQRFIRTGRSFAIVLADIDFFKRFNDEHGHACGDHVLKGVSAILSKHSRGVDRVGRWGGEEFVLMLPETDKSGARKFSEKLRADIENEKFEYDNKALNTTMTFGVATSLKGETLDECIHRADMALYQGKEQGRNRVMG